LEERKRLVQPICQMGFGFLIIVHVYLNPMSHQELLTKEELNINRCLKKRKREKRQNTRSKDKTYENEAKIDLNKFSLNKKKKKKKNI
jgi:hypothetical protein